MAAFAQQMIPFLMQRPGLVWRLYNADVHTQLTIYRKGSGVGNYNLKWAGQKLVMVFPGELTPALLGHSGILGQEMILPRVRGCPSPKTAPPFGIVGTLQVR